MMVPGSLGAIAVTAMSVTVPLGSEALTGASRDVPSSPATFAQVEDRL